MCDHSRYGPGTNIQIIISSSENQIMLVFSLSICASVIPSVTNSSDIILAVLSESVYYQSPGQSTEQRSWPMYFNTTFLSHNDCEVVLLV